MLCLSPMASSQDLNSGVGSECRTGCVERKGTRIRSYRERFSHDSGRSTAGVEIAKVGDADSAHNSDMIRADRTSETYVSPQTGHAYTIIASDVRGSFFICDRAGAPLLNCSTDNGENYCVFSPAKELAAFSYTALHIGNSVAIGSQSLSIASASSAFLSDEITSASIMHNGTTAATFIFTTKYGSGSKLVGAPPHSSALLAARKSDYHRRPAISKAAAWKIEDFVLALICAISVGMTIEAGIGLFAFGLSTYATISECTHLRSQG